jgi:hypothetical protein
MGELVQIKQAITSAKKKRTFTEFWVECWRDAWSSSWAFGGILNLMLSIIIPIASLLDPNASAHQTQWAWLTGYFAALGTVAAGWVVLTVRLLIWAPYNVLKNIEAKSQLDISTILGGFNEFRSALDDKLAKSEAQHNIAMYIIRGHEVLKALQTPEFLVVAEKWSKETELFIAKNLGSFATITFSNPKPLGPVDMTDPFKLGRHIISAKIRALENIALQIDTFYRPVAASFEEVNRDETKVKQPSSTQPEVT